MNTKRTLILIFSILIVFYSCKKDMKQSYRKCDCNAISLAFKEIRVPVPYEHPHSTLHSERVGFTVDFSIVINKDKIKKGEILAHKNSKFEKVFGIFPKEAMDIKEQFYYISPFFIPIRTIEKPQLNLDDVLEYNVFYVNNKDTCSIEQHDKFEVCINSIETKFSCDFPLWISDLKRL